MGDNAAELRERMLRHAIIHLLRGLSDPSHGGVSVIDTGLVADVTVEGDSVRVELGLSTRRRLTAPLVREIRRRVESLPEVAEVAIAEQQRCHGRPYQPDSPGSPTGEVHPAQRC